MAVRKVMCVDDARADLTNIEKIVAGASCSVVTASNGKEALAVAKAERPDLIFMDVNMAEMDGFAATRELKKDPDTKAIPIVFVTSKNQKADRVWAQMQGGAGYVTKPYGADDILQHIRAF